VQAGFAAIAGVASRFTGGFPNQAPVAASAELERDSQEHLELGRNYLR